MAVHAPAPPMSMLRFATLGSSKCSFILFSVSDGLFAAASTLNLVVAGEPPVVGLSCGSFWGAISSIVLFSATGLKNPLGKKFCWLRVRPPGPSAPSCEDKAWPGRRASRHGFT